MSAWCGRAGYPHPAHEDCLGYDDRVADELVTGWAPADGMTEEGRAKLRSAREG